MRSGVANARFFAIPAWTRATTCRRQSCQKRIYFVTNPDTGRLTPVDPDVEGGKRSSESKELGQLDMLSGGEAEVYDGRGVSHFLTCADAEMFSHGGVR